MFSGKTEQILCVCVCVCVWQSRHSELTLQPKDSVMWSAMQSSNGISSTVVPKTLKDPGRCDDRGRPAGDPPFIGHRGTNSGPQPGKAAE